MNNNAINNNEVNNNNLEGAKTMEKKIIIKKTENKRGVNGFTGFNKEVHAAMSKKVLRNTLYSWAPVYRMITITGFKDKAGKNIACKIRNVIGGNSPVMRAFVEPSTTVQNISVVQIDDNGNETFRNIQIGIQNGRVKYDLAKQIVLIRFEIDEKDDDMDSSEFVEEILSKGLTINGKEVTIGRKDEGEYIEPLIWTPSNERSGQILFTSLDPTYAWNILEKIGGGSITRKLAGKISIAKFKKLASRLGLFATPAIEFAKVGNESHGLLVIDHELTGSDDFDETTKKTLAKIGIEIDTKQWDGAAFFTADLALKGLHNIGMKQATFRQALMFAFQLRVEQVYAKVFGEALTSFVLDKMAKYLMKQLPSNKYRIYGNPNKIAMILDSNAAKIIDLEQDMDESGVNVYLLDIAKGSKSGTSTQLLDKCAIADKEATAKCLRTLAKEECHDYANSIGDKPFSLLDDDINVWQALLNIAKNLPEDSEIGLNIFEDQYIMSRLLKDVAKKHEAALSKGRVSINSQFERALFDSTFLLTDGKVDSLLGVNSIGAIECYSNDMLEIYADEIDAIENSNMTEEQKDKALDKLLTSTIVKFPTPGMEEIELVVFKTERQIKNRIESLVERNIIDENTGKIVFNYFNFTSYGVIKLAADNALKHKLAGMDTDYDGVLVINEKALVDIFVKVYKNRSKKLKEERGLIAPHGGTIPFIVCSKEPTKAKEIPEELNNSYGVSLINSIGNAKTPDFL